MINLMKKVYRKIFKKKLFKFDLEKNYIAEIKNVSFNQLIAIDGIGFSGSSAVTDFLGEFDCNTTCGGVDLYENPERGLDNNYETDFFRDPYSVLDLEKICYNHVTRIGDQAIKDFIKTVELNYTRGPSLIFHNDIYLKSSKEFILNVVDFVTSIHGQPRYIVKSMTAKQYRSYAKDYILKILSSINSKTNLVMDNLISIEYPDCEIINDYFPDNTKLIYVWRDPRDIYAQARMTIHEDCAWVPEKPEVFIKWYTKAFPYYLNSKCENIMCVRFEDLVLNYDETAKQIFDFLNITDYENYHINKKKFFNPNISKNNIGLYKNYVDQTSIKYIYENLKDFCYE